MHFPVLRCRWSLATMMQYHLLVVASYDDPLVSFAWLKKSEKSKIVCPTEKERIELGDFFALVSTVARVVVWFTSSLSGGGGDFAAVTLRREWKVSGVFCGYGTRRDCTLHLLACMIRFPGRFCEIKNLSPNKNRMHSLVVDPHYFKMSFVSARRASFSVLRVCHEAY